MAFHCHLVAGVCPSMGKFNSHRIDDSSEAGNRPPGKIEQLLRPSVRQDRASLERAYQVVPAWEAEEGRPHFGECLSKPTWAQFRQFRARIKHWDTGTDLRDIDPHSIRAVLEGWGEERQHGEVDGLPRCRGSVDRNEEAVVTIGSRTSRLQIEVDLRPACRRPANLGRCLCENRAAVRTEPRRERPGEGRGCGEAVVERCLVRPGGVDLDP